jgi:hypothetical protein
MRQRGLTVLQPEQPENLTGHAKKTEISPALASFATGASTTIFTIAATLVSLRADVPRETLFLVLSWTMYASGACVVGVFGWLLLNSIRRSLKILNYLAEMEPHIPRLLRIRRRSEQVQITVNGNAHAQYEFEIESAPGVFAPWLTLQFFAGVDPGAVEWQSLRLRKVLVDGVEFDSTQAFTKVGRGHNLRNPRWGHLITEEGAVRIPISLEPKRRRCTVLVEMEMRGAFAQLFSGGQEDAWTVDVTHVTDELSVSIKGVDNLELFCSPRADYRVLANQMNGDLLDTAESQLESSTCSMRDGVQWRSTNTKLGYRYQIFISARTRAG